MTRIFSAAPLTDYLASITAGLIRHARQLPPAVSGAINTQMPADVVADIFAAANPITVPEIDWTELRLRITESTVTVRTDPGAPPLGWKSPEFAL